MAEGRGERGAMGGVGEGRWQGRVMSGEGIRGEE